MLNSNRKLRRQARRNAGRVTPGKKDAGFTLPELLVSVVLTGLLVSTIGTAITVMLKAAPQAEVRLAESKDITFLQTFIPVDLATAINSYDSPDDAAVQALLLNADPFVTYSNNPDGSKLLPGTNVLTLLIPVATGGYEIISYRYVEVPVGSGEWQLSRFRIQNPGQVNQKVTPVGVAHEIAAPPAGWVEGQPVDHVFQIDSRNQVVLRPVGEDIKVLFESGKEFRTGGAGLSAEQDLTPNDPDTLPDPTAPPTRCGGRVALVLDTSWSVPQFNGGAPLESAATGFLDAFVGTPTFATVMGFDGLAYQLYPNLNGTRGQYFSLLNPLVDSNGDGITDLENAKGNIRALPNVDGPQASNSAYYSAPSGVGIGPVADKNVNWSKPRTSEDGTKTITGYTNWEDSLHAPFFDQAGVLRPETPELVIWVTDGQPNIDRASALGAKTAVAAGPATAAAEAAARRGRGTGARIVGVFVGPQGELAENMEQVVGENAWDGSATDVDGDGEYEIDLGNAKAADYFTGGFSQLGGVLRTIIAAQCGGTVTVRKALVDGSSPGGQWTYSSETGGQVLDLGAKQSVTFDYTFATGAFTKVITIREEVKNGFTFVRADCTVAGEPVDGADITQSPDGIPGVELTIGPDEAVSCVMVSQPI